MTQNKNEDEFRTVQGKSNQEFYVEQINKNSYVVYKENEKDDPNLVSTADKMTCDGTYFEYNGTCPHIDAVKDFISNKEYKTDFEEFKESCEGMYDIELEQVPIENLRVVLDEISGYIETEVDYTGDVLFASDGQYNMIIESIAPEDFVIQIYEKDRITGHEKYNQKHNLETFGDSDVDMINQI